MDCKHELENIVGVAGGVICKKCGQHFDHIPKQEAPAAAPKKAPAKAPAKRTGGAKRGKQ